MTMKIALAIAAVVAAGCFATAAAAQPLSIVQVGAPSVNCVFNNAGAPNCTVVVDDSIGNFTLPNDTGAARLQTRTYPGAVGAPAAGDTAYVYRVDLTNVKGGNCVANLTVISGPAVVKLPYRQSTPQQNFDLFVVTSGGLGTVGPTSAVQNGNEIFFTFNPPVCPGATSYFFGFASAATPVASTAVVANNHGGVENGVPDRAP